MHWVKYPNRTPGPSTLFVTPPFDNLEVKKIRTVLGISVNSAFLTGFYNYGLQENVFGITYKYISVTLSYIWFYPVYLGILLIFIAFYQFMLQGPLPLGKAMNIRAIPKYTGKIQTWLSSSERNMWGCSIPFRQITNSRQNWLKCCGTILIFWTPTWVCKHRALWWEENKRWTGRTCWFLSSRYVSPWMLASPWVPRPNTFPSNCTKLENTDLCLLSAWRVDLPCQLHVWVPLDENNKSGTGAVLRKSISRY